MGSSFWWRKTNIDMTVNRQDPLWHRIADAILETTKGQPPVGDTAGVVEKGTPAKPQPRYQLQNKGPKKKTPSQ